MMVMQDLTPSGLRLGHMPAILPSWMAAKSPSRFGRWELVQSAEPSWLSSDVSTRPSLLVLSQSMSGTRKRGNTTTWGRCNVLRAHSLIVTQSIIESFELGLSNIMPYASNVGISCLKEWTSVMGLPEPTRNNRKTSILFDYWWRIPARRCPSGRPPLLLDSRTAEEEIELLTSRPSWLLHITCAPIFRDGVRETAAYCLPQVREGLRDVS